MLRDVASRIGVALDTRLRQAIHEFGVQSGHETVSDTVRTLILLGLERTAQIESSILKAGYRAGANRGLALIKENLMKVLNEEMSRIDASDDLTKEVE